MKKIANLACIVLTALSLAACSYFDTGEGPETAAAQPVEGEQIDSVVLAPVEYKDVADVIHSSSDGRVQIFPLDGGEEWPTETAPDAEPSYSSSDAIDIKPVEAIPTYNESYLNAYPGVEIFPLDDDMASIVNPRLVPRSGSLPIGLTPVPGEQAGKDFVVLGTPGGPQTVVYFDHDSVTLKPADTSMLTGLAKSYSGQEVAVVGHASVTSSLEDPVQRKIINLKISMDRAFAVARALIEGGIPPERIETKGYGEVRPPLAPSQPVEVASRRVEIYGVSVQ